MIKPLVIVLSRSHATALSVIRSLGAVGYTIDLIASAHRRGGSIVAASSKYVRNVVELVSNRVREGQEEAETALVAELLKRAGQNETKPVLFPTDDYTTAVIDCHRSELEPYYLMPSIVGAEDGTMMNLMDKTVQAEMARQVGLPVPQEWVFDLTKEPVVPEDMVFPCYCKPIKSITGYKGEMAVCKNEAELLAHMNRLRSKFANRSILVQEFLNIDYEIDLSGVCLDQEVIIPAIIRKTRVAQQTKGVTLTGKIIPFEELGDLQEKVVELLKKFRYVGMFDMELTVVGDRIYFNEVNLRSGGPNYAYFKSGVNLPALFVKEILGERHLPEEEKVGEYGKTFIYEKVAWDDYIHGYMTKKELKQAIEQADITLLYNKEDPMPQRLFRLWMWLRIIKRGRNPQISQRRKALKAR